MPDAPPQNAALYYVADAYGGAGDRKTLAGRRVAGTSFLRGFVEHSGVGEFYALAPSRDDQTEFVTLMKQLAPDRRATAYARQQIGDLATPGLLHFPDPNIGAYAWRRYRFGGAAFSICGITHGMSGQSVMNALFDVFTSPVEPWDGIICTSAAVQAMVRRHFDLTEEFFRRRGGAVGFARPQTPVIPLGVHADEFAADPAAGAALRAQLGIADEDVVAMTLSRLSPQQKFDPLPYYQALSAAAKRTPGRLHLILCGVMADSIAGAVFREGARALARNVSVHLLDGASAAARAGAFAAADMFVFPIDNIQESFGLAPIEAMAAGLPVVASDWDGMKDTVTEDVGFRIPTRFASPGHGEMDRFLLHCGYDSAPAHQHLVSSYTAIDQRALADAIAALAASPDLRRRKGAAAAMRAREVYDWSRIVPRYQAFWRELAERRAAADAGQGAYAGLPSPRAPAPSYIFQSYPSGAGFADGDRFERVAGASAGSVRQVFALRGARTLKRTAEPLERYLAVFEAAPGARYDDLRDTLGMPEEALERCLLWLLKYDQLRLTANEAP